MAKTKTAPERYVVVTTDKDRRGVFGGILESHDGQTAVLRDARMAVYWSAETKGVTGLASIGPQRGSKITPAVPRIKLDGVTSVMDCTTDARKKWDEGSWG